MDVRACSKVALVLDLTSLPLLGEHVEFVVLLVQILSGVEQKQRRYRRHSPGQLSEAAVVRRRRRLLPDSGSRNQQTKVEGVHGVLRLLRSIVLPATFKSRDVPNLAHKIGVSFVATVVLVRARGD